MPLLQRLVLKGILSEADIPAMKEVVASSPDRFLSELLSKGHAKEEQVLAVLGEELGLDVVDLTQIKVDPATLLALPLKLLHRRTLMPIARNNGNLTVATGDPFDIYALDELQTLTGLVIKPVLASPREISRLLKAHFGVGGETVTALVQERDRAELLQETDAADNELAKMAQEASVFKLFNEILIEATNQHTHQIPI